MADPQHEEALTAFDRLTVRLYRTALTWAALGLAVLGYLYLHGPAAWGGANTLPGDAADGTWRLRVVWLVLAGCMALAALNLHLYAPVFRWLVTALAWAGVWLLAGAWAGLPAVMGSSFTAAGRQPAFGLGTGFVLAGLAALAMKERFCFIIPLLSAVPALLFAAWAAIALGAYRPAGLVLVATAVVYLVLVIAKWRMPLHYDIGDKQHYQV